METSTVNAPITERSYLIPTAGSDHPIDRMVMVYGHGFAIGRIYAPHIMDNIIVEANGRKIGTAYDVKEGSDMLLQRRANQRAAAAAADNRKGNDDPFKGLTA